MARYSEEIGSLSKRMLQKIESGEASDSDYALLNILTLMQQGYKERNDSDKAVMAKMDQIHAMLTPKDGDRSGLVTWNQVQQDWKMFWAVVTGIPTLVGVITVITTIFVTR